MTGPPLPFETQNVHKSAPPGSRETAGARLKSGPKPQKTNQNQNKKAKCSKLPRVRYTFHARRRKPTRNAQSKRLFCVHFSWLPTYSVIPDLIRDLCCLNPRCRASGMGAFLGAPQSGAGRRLRLTEGSRTMRARSCRGTTQAFL